MARATQTQTDEAERATGALAPAATDTGERAAPVDREKVLPLPGWLVKVYFIFPLVLYVPDAIFNFYVYSDGAKVQNSGNTLLDVGSVVLWAFVSLGVVGMAYLLSVLAPWHWGQGHRIQAFFCAIGVVIATAITTWNSLAFRSEGFKAFRTDEWAYHLWPQLQNAGVSLTMILVATAPPFWGLFWAIVQPTETGRNLRQLQESHQERLLRMQQEAEVKRLRAETNAKIREAQLKGMALTAGAAREQMNGLLAARKKDGQATNAELPAVQIAGELPAASEAHPGEAADEARQPDDSDAHILAYMTPAAKARTLAEMYNSAAPASPPVRMEPAAALHSDVDGGQGVPMGDALPFDGPRRPATPFSPGLLDGDPANSGVRPAASRPSSRLLDQMNQPPAAWSNAVQEAMRELNPNGTRRNVPAREMHAKVAEKLNVDEQSARTIINRVREAQRARN